MVCGHKTSFALQARKMKDQDLRFLKSVFAEYYSKYSEAVYVPPPVNSREIGFVLWPERVMARHMSFPSLADIRRRIMDDTPVDAYHSCAVYEFPEKPMGYKNELWVDLAFDVDAKDVRPDCLNDATYSVCKKCGHHRKGAKKTCPDCSQQYQVVEFISPECIKSTGEQAKKLHAALVDEIGVDPKEISVYFSGHMGFHVYATSKAIGELGADARREITSYLALEGAAGGHATGKSELGGIGTKRMNKRLLSQVLDIVTNPTENKDVLGNSGVELVEQNSPRLLPSLEKGAIQGLIGLLGTAKTKKVLKKALQRAAVIVDPSVTMDVHRIFRMPGTLNSKSGLPKQLVTLEEIDKGILSLLPEYGRANVQLSIAFAPEIEIGQESVGPFSNEVATVPRYIGAYLILKGVASVG